MAQWYRMQRMSQLEVRPLEKCRGADAANSAATRTSPPAPIHVVARDQCVRASTLTALMFIA